jgi:hypothetical protein
MKTYLLKLGRGLKGPAHMHGALFVAPQALHFLCTYAGVTDRGKLEQFGPVGAALEGYRKTGAAPQVEESEVARLVSSTEHSISIPASKIELLSRSMWSGSKIVYDGGQKLVVWNPGFSGKFRDYMREWAQQNSVKTKGL